MKKPRLLAVLLISITLLTASCSADNSQELNNKAAAGLSSSQSYPSDPKSAQDNIIQAKNVWEILNSYRLIDLTYDSMTHAQYNSLIEQMKNSVKVIGDPLLNTKFQAYKNAENDDQEIAAGEDMVTYLYALETKLLNLSRPSDPKSAQDNISQVKNIWEVLNAYRLIDLTYDNMTRDQYNSLIEQMTNSVKVTGDPLLSAKFQAYLSASNDDQEYADGEDMVTYLYALVSKLLK